MEDPITWESLGTVAGASGAALVVVTFLRIFLRIHRETAQKIAAIIAVGLLVLAVLAGSDAGWREWVLGVLSGLAAGIAAASMLEGIGREPPPTVSEPARRPIETGASLKLIPHINREAVEKAIWDFRSRMRAPSSRT